MIKPNNKIRLAIAQINTAVGDFAGNTKKIINFIDKAKEQGSDIVVFPELAICGYPPEDLLFKSGFIRENIKHLDKIRNKTPEILAVVGFADKKGRELFNSAALIYNKKILDIYNKIHLPNYGVFDEKRYFCEGSGFKLYYLGGACIAVNICEDTWINDGVVAAQAKKGANLILTINASVYHMGKIHQRRQILKKQAQKNKVFILYTNLVGGQDELVFDGQSMLISDKGKVLAIAAAFKEDLRVVDIHTGDLPKKAEAKNIKILDLEFNPKDDKTKALTAGRALRLSLEEEVFSALSLGTGDYALKNGFQKVILGLSGGIDSSIVACIAKEALGPGNVLGVILPSQFNSQDSYDDAVRLADNLGIEYRVIAIQGIFEDYLKILGPHFLNRPWNTAEENLQARIRGNILMALSNKFGWLVLTTGNKSEMAVGYATLYGDMAGGFAAIKDVPKILVYKLAEFYNAYKGAEIIPKRVFKKPPTAELRRNQKDADSLPAYEILDPILRYYIEGNLSASQIIKKGFESKEVIRTIQMVDRSEYKRRQAPVGIKITPRAFGRDRRMPISNKFKDLT